MKRVARADSPEVVRVSEVSPESSFRELDDVFLQTQARIWLGEVLHIRFDEETPIADLLADGELLFQLSKVVWKMLLKKHDELKNSKIFVYERTSFAKSDGRYIPYPKVDSFLKICQIIGLTGIDLFSPSDVVEKRDIRRVCMCIRCLSKQARSKNLSVPDFDIVTYTIAMPTDLVGGIRRSLEQSGCSSSSSGNCSKGFRRLYRQKDYSEHHDQRHDYCYESDEAESSFNELEFERLPSNISYGASDIFTLDGEGCPQGRLGGDNLSKLRTYFELEGQTHGENGHESEHHGASIFLESIGSPFGSITENGSHDTSITVQSDSCLPCTKLQTDESASPYSIGEEQGVQPLGWSRFGEQVWNSDIDCRQRCFLSCAKSPYEVEAQMGGKESQSYLDFVPKNFLPKSSTFDTHISTGDANEENIKSCVGGTSKKVSNARDRHDNVECECEIQHEKDQDGSSAYMLQSHDGELRCKNMTWLLDEKDDGKHKTSIHDNWKMTPGSSVVEWVSSDLTCQNMHHADIVLLDSEVPGSLSSLSMRNEGSQGKGSRCEQEMGIIDQAIDAEESSTPTLKLIPDKAATVPNDDKLHHDNLSAENFLFPEVHAFKNNAKSSLISEVSSIEHGTNRNWKDGRIVRPQNCDSYFDFEDVASAFKTIEWTQPCQSDGLNDSWTTISKGQDFTGILDGSFPKDTLSANTCSTSTYGTLEAERRLPLDTAIPEKTNLFNCVLARDANRQLNCSAVHQDEDSTVDIVSAINTKTYGKIVGSQMDKIDWHLIGSQSELKAENHDTQNECKMVIKVDGQDNGSYHDPCEANIDLSVVVGSNLFKKKLNKSNHHMECENISGSFRESSSVLSGLDTNYEHPIFVSTADDSCMPTCSRDYSEQTLPVEARNIRDSHSSVPTGMFSVHATSYVCLQHIHKSILKTSYKTSPQTRNDVAGRNCVNNLDPYCRNEICRLGTGGAGVAKNSEVPYSCCSKDLRHMEYMGSYNANKVTSDRSYGSGTVSTSKPVHCSTTAHTSAPADSDDDCTTTQAIWQCSNPGILAEGKGDISAEVNFENKYQVHHLVDDVGTSMNHTVPDATEERKKDMEECSKNPLTTMTSSGKSREETVAKVRNPGKKVLKSIAGGVTLIGALLFFLHLRRKREKEKNSHTVAPLPTKETFQEVYTQNKMEIDKSDKKYPGERLKL